MILLDDSFWRLDVSKLLEVVIFCATWIISKLLDSQKKSDKVDEHDRWILEHKAEDSKRDEILAKINDNLTRLTTLQESNEYRLRNLETDMKEVRR